MTEVAGRSNTTGRGNAPGRRTGWILLAGWMSLAVWMTLLVTGCSGSGGGTSAGGGTSPGTGSQPPTSSAAVPLPSTPTTPSVSTSPTTTQPASQPASQGTPSRCRTAQVQPSLVPGRPGAGQRHAELRLQNTSNLTCTVLGYGGMQLVTSTGEPVPTDLVRSEPGLRRPVTLRPGESASSRLHWGVVAVGDEPATGACEPTASKVQVTPPDERDPVVAPWTLGPVCGNGKIDQEPFRATAS